MSVRQLTKLRAALGDYARTRPLKTNAITSPSIAFEFSEIQPVYKVFAAMVRERAFDVSEMAIVAYLQAKAHGKPLWCPSTTWWWSPRSWRDRSPRSRNQAAS